MSTKTTTHSLCTCGCGIPVNKPKSLYRPGHDARHAGFIARDVLAGGDLALLKALPSVALRVKAERMIKGAVAKASKPAKSPKSGSPVIAEAPAVKVGRWTYPARTVDGLLERNAKRDGSGEWVAV